MEEELSSQAINLSDENENNEEELLRQAIALSLIENNLLECFSSSKKTLLM